MKKFNETQKNWFLSTCLVASLGFSVSFHSPEVSGEMNLSLTAEPEIRNLVTTQGRYDVKLMKTGDNSSVAVLLKPDGAAVCEGLCGKSIPLDLKVDDIQKIEEALVKKIAEKPEAKVEKDKTDKADKEDTAKDDAATQREEEQTKLLERINNNCKNEEGTNMVSCKVRGLNDLLNRKLKLSNKDERISKELAYKFYLENIDKSLKSYLNNINNGNARADALLVFNEIVSNTPKEYNVIRERAIMMGVELNRSNLIEIRNLKSQASRLQDGSPEKYDLEVRAYNKAALMNEMDYLFGKNAIEGLELASSLRNLDESLKNALYSDTYLNLNRRLTTMLNQAQRSNNYNFQIPRFGDIHSLSNPDIIILRDSQDSFVGNQFNQINGQNINGRQYTQRQNPDGTITLVPVNGQQNMNGQFMQGPGNMNMNRNWNGTGPNVGVPGTIGGNGYTGGYANGPGAFNNQVGRNIYNGLPTTGFRNQNMNGRLFRVGP